MTEPPVPRAAAGYGRPYGRPGTITAAVLLTCVGSVFEVLSAVATARASLRQLVVGFALDPVAVVDATTPGQRLVLVVVAGLMLAVAVVLVVLALLVGRGYGWPRVALTVLGGAHVLAYLYLVAFGAPQNIVAIAYVAGVVTLLWLEPSSTWVNAHRDGTGFTARAGLRSG